VQGWSYVSGIIASPNSINVNDVIIQHKNSDEWQRAPQQAQQQVRQQCSQYAPRGMQASHIISLYIMKL
jgi:hypothetical protein